MSDNNRILLFTVGMTTVVALVLGVLFFGLKDAHAKNEAVFNKRAILEAVGNYLPTPVDELTDDEVQEIFTNNVKTNVYLADGSEVPGVDAANVKMAKEKKKPEAERNYPLYTYNNGKEDFYILSVYGNGLWDAIWGNIALKSDGATIAGASFDHKGETPGLGAEIKDNKKWSSQFADKRIYDLEGNFTSVLVRKGGAKDPIYEVDGISGATVTANGVSDMLKSGIAKYSDVLEDIQAKAPKASGKVGMLLN
ncbi:MAG: NADH:ubiquinone reductase (Na(+)-transporting) subunit C [Saprospiraceae bacterium]